MLANNPIIGPPEESFLLKGSGSPVGTITGVLGQSYLDLVAHIFYRCISDPSGTVWVVV